MIDLHIHSSYSSDCDTPIEETIKKAIKKNIKVIAITDHIDYDYKDPTINFDFNVDDFMDEIHELKSKYTNDIEVLVGLELGLQEHIVPKLKALTNQYKFDYIIGSFHTVDSKDLYRGDFYEGKSPIKAWRCYLEEVIETLKKFDDFSVLGHLDLIKRYNKDVRQVPLSEYKDLLVRLFEIINEKNIGLEVNTSGLRPYYGLNETLPSMDILQLYYESGGRLITIGSDSHQTDTLGSHYEEVIKKLKKIGFTKIYKFNQLKPIQYESID